MAQILVQKKQKSYWWLWLLILVIVLGVLYYLYTQGMLEKTGIQKPANRPAAMLITAQQATFLND